MTTFSGFSTVSYTHLPRSRVYHLGGGTLQTDSPAKVFYNHRNNLAMLYKCASPAQRLCVDVYKRQVRMSRKNPFGDVSDKRFRGMAGRSQIFSTFGGQNSTQ